MTAISQPDSCQPRPSLMRTLASMLAEFRIWKERKINAERRYEPNTAVPLVNGRRVKDDNEIH